MLCNVGQVILDFICCSKLGRAMFGKVFLNILCDSLFYTNAMQCRTWGVRLYFLLLIWLFIVGNGFLEHILLLATFHKCCAMMDLEIKTLSVAVN